MEENKEKQSGVVAADEEEQVISSWIKRYQESGSEKWLDLNRELAGTYGHNFKGQQLAAKINRAVADAITNEESRPPSGM